MQHGTGKGAFLSGFVSSGFSVGGDAKFGAVKMAVVGGTASAIGGGKFSNGAMGSAFQYLFNDLYANGFSKEANDSTTEDFRAKHPGAFSVHVHGGTHSLEINGVSYDTTQISELREIFIDNGWDGQQDIILFSCSVGSDRNGAFNMASTLSKELNVNVYAPTNYYSLPGYLPRLLGAQGYVSNRYGISDGYMKKFGRK